MHIIFVSPFANKYRLLQNEELDFVEPATVIEVNVGGQIFEISAETLIREPFSILAALCRKKPLIGGDVIYIDRDWWIFRHVLAYLKSNVLPTELDILQELYREATFYRLDGLKKAIENTPLHEVTSPANRFATTKEERSSVR